MGLVEVVIWLMVIGVALYLINTYVPMAAPIKTILNVVVIVVLCLWLLRLLGVMNVIGPR